MILFLFLIAGSLWAQLWAQAAPAPIRAKEIAKAQLPAAPSNKPAKSEALHFNVNWPSGLSLGEAELSATPSDSALHFALQMDASLPGFAVSETVSSRATKGYCSLELSKRGTRGKRKVDERTEFDTSALKATRQTKGGGKSEVSISPCAKDALTFVHFLRRELAAGRLPAQQKVYYGAAYDVRVTFAGTQQIVIGGESVEADKLTATIKGASEITADLFFAKDAGRTPLLIQTPLPMGKFSMELVR